MKDITSNLDETNSKYRVLNEFILSQPGDG